MSVSSPTVTRGPGNSVAGGKSLSQKDPPLAETRPVIRSAVYEDPNISVQHAAHIRDSSASIFMYSSVGTVLVGVDLAAFRIFRDRLLVDYGQPSDPIVVMMLEQLAPAHLNIGHLFGKSSSANSTESAEAYLSAATRLMGEFRRSAQAIPAYREAVQRLEQGADTEGPCQEKSPSDSELLESEDSHEPSIPMQSNGLPTDVRITDRTPRKVSPGNAG